MQVAQLTHQVQHSEQEAAAARQQLAESEEAYEMLQEACCSMEEDQAQVVGKQAALEQELVASTALEQEYALLQKQHDDLLTRLELAQDQV